jgi:hypothetical protein
MFAVDARDAAMSVTHVFAKTDISDGDEFGTFLFNCAQCFLNDAVLRVGAARSLIFLIGNSKKQNGLEPGVLRGAGLIDNFVDCELKNAGHARDGAAFVDLIADKKRENEIVRGRIRLAHEVPQRRRTPEPSRTMDQFSHPLEGTRLGLASQASTLDGSGNLARNAVVKSSNRAALLLVALFAIAGFLVWKCESDAGVNFLPRHRGAEWIVFPAPPDANLHPLVSLDAIFRREFALPGKPIHAQLRLRAARIASLKINGVDVDLVPPKNWKDEMQSDVASLLREGANVIEVKVANDRAPPALWLWLSVGDSQLASGADWNVSFTGSSARRVALADVARLPAAGNAIAEPTTTVDALVTSWPWLVLFAIVAAARDALVVAPYRKEFHQILAGALEHTGDSTGVSEQSNYAKLLDSRTARP